MIIKAMAANPTHSTARVRAAVVATAAVLVYLIQPAGAAAAGAEPASYAPNEVVVRFAPRRQAHDGARGER